jgi:DNA-binding HxlR family transcriptional regulator
MPLRHKGLRHCFCEVGRAPRGRRDDGCLIREILNRVGDKWSVLVVALLGGGARRFSELRSTIDGISQRMLTTTLRGLERDGLIRRTVFPTTPPRVEYELTTQGRTLLKPIMALADWAERHRTAIKEARDRYDRAAQRPRTGGR